MRRGGPGAASREEADRIQAHPCPLTGQQEPRGSEGPHISVLNCPPSSGDVCPPQQCRGYTGTVSDVTRRSSHTWPLTPAGLP